MSPRCSLSPSVATVTVEERRGTDDYRLRRCDRFGGNGRGLRANEPNGRVASGVGQENPNLGHALVSGTPKANGLSARLERAWPNTVQFFQRKAKLVK
jgi:hypothetical protein